VVYSKGEATKVASHIYEVFEAIRIFLDKSSFTKLKKQKNETSEKSVRESIECFFGKLQARSQGIAPKSTRCYAKNAGK